MNGMRRAIYLWRDLGELLYLVGEGVRARCFYEHELEALKARIPPSQLEVLEEPPHTIAHLNLPVAVYRRLIDEGIVETRVLIRYTGEGLARLAKFGPKHLAEVEEALAKMGLHLRRVVVRKRIR